MSRLKDELTKTHKELSKLNGELTETHKELYKLRDELKKTREALGKLNMEADISRTSMALLESKLDHKERVNQSLCDHLKSLERYIRCIDSDVLRQDFQVEIEHTIEICNAVVDGLVEKTSDICAMAVLAEEQNDALNREIEMVIEGCDAVADDLVQKIKDACAAETRYPRTFPCAVCLQNFGFTNFAVKGCGHTICIDCAKPINMGKMECPMCRNPTKTPFVPLRFA